MEHKEVKSDTKMCGIAGIVYFNGRCVDPFLLKRMSQIQQHRGPDDEGHVLLSLEPHLNGALEFKEPREVVDEDITPYRIGLGFRRLSIIDLSAAGHQPMCNEDRTIWIVFNGEFYNYLEHRELLSGQGHVFKSRTDTEVILHLYEEVGIEKTLESMNGMFAFALCDLRRSKLYLVRDRIGIKPCYYYNIMGNGFVFASEIKAILEVVRAATAFDSSYLVELLENRYVNAPNTVFRGVKKLLPGTYLEVDISSGAIREYNYWSVFSCMNNSSPSVEQYHDLLLRSLRYRLRSDVPVGVFLSGGLDSSTLCGVIRKRFNMPLKTFSISFEAASGIDESWASKEVSTYLATDHYDLVFRKEMFEALPEVVWHCEEPIADPALLPTYYLSQMTRSHVTVALSGEGSDETNYGYDHYKIGRMGKALLLLPKWLREKAAAFLFPFLSGEDDLKRTVLLMRDPLGGWDNEGFIPRYRFQTFLKSIPCSTGNGRGRWWKTRFHARSIYDARPLVHFHTWLPDDLLLKVDKMSMAHSLEVRVPYLDHELLDVGLRVVARHKLSFLSTKIMLRKLSSLYLPPSITNRQQHGFLLPLENILENEIFGKKKTDKPLFKDYLYLAQDVIDPERAIETLAPEKRLNPKATTQLWLLAMIRRCIEPFNSSIHKDIPCLLKALPLTTFSKHINQYFCGNETRMRVPWKINNMFVL